MSFEEEKKAGLIIFDDAQMSWLNADKNMLLRSDSIDIYAKTYLNHLFSIGGPFYENLKCRLPEELIGDNINEKVLYLVKKTQDFLWKDLKEDDVSIQDKITELNEAWSEMWLKLYSSHPDIRKEYPTKIFEGKEIIPDKPPVWFMQKGFNTLAITIFTKMLNKNFGKFTSTPIDIIKLEISSPMLIKLFVAKTINYTLFLLNNGVFLDDARILHVYKVMYDEEMPKVFRDSEVSGKWYDKIRTLFFENVCTLLMAKYKNISNLSDEIIKTVDIKKDLIKMTLINAEKDFLEPIVKSYFDFFLKSLRYNKEEYVIYASLEEDDYKRTNWKPCVVAKETIEPIVVHPVKDTDTVPLKVPTIPELIFFRDVNIEKIREISETKILNDKEKKQVIKHFLNNLFTKNRGFFNELQTRYMDPIEGANYEEKVTDDKILNFFKIYQNWIIHDDGGSSVEGSTQKKYDAFVNRLIKTYKDAKYDLTKPKLIKHLKEISALKLDKLVTSIFGKYDKKLIDLTQKGISLYDKISNEDELVRYIMFTIRITIMLAVDSNIEGTEVFLKSHGVDENDIKKIMGI